MTPAPWTVEATVSPPDFDQLRDLCGRVQFDTRSADVRAAVRAGLDMAMTALTRREELGLPTQGERFRVKIQGSPGALRCDVRRVR